MSRYWFHISDANGRVEDEDGAEFPSLSAALKAALNSAREFLADAPQPGSLRFEITNEHGRILAVVPINSRALNRAVNTFPPDERTHVEVLRAEEHELPALRVSNA